MLEVSRGHGWHGFCEKRPVMALRKLVPLILTVGFIVQIPGVVRGGTVYVTGSLSRAEELYSQGRYREAADVARSVLSLKPGPPFDSKAMLILARSCFKVGDYRCSVENYSKLFSMGKRPKLIDDYLFFGESLERVGSPVEASKVYLEAERIFKGDSRLGEVLYRRGLIEERLGRVDEAIKILLKALELAKANRELHMKVCFALGDCYMERGNTLAARSFYWEALSLGVDPEPFLKSHLKTYQNLSDIRFMFGLYKEAASGYIEIAKLSGRSSLARKDVLKAGDCYLAMERPKEALELYAKVIRDYPDSDEALIGMLKMADLSVKFPGMQVPPKSEYSPYRRPLDVYVMLTKCRIPELAQLAYIRAAEFLSKEGNYKGALDMVSKGMEAFPGGKLQDQFIRLACDITSRWIGLLFQKKDYLGVLRVYADHGSWLKGDGADPALKKVAFSMLSEGLPDKALSILMGVRLEGDDVLLLARSYISLLKYSDALGVLKGYIKNHPKSCEAHRLMGDAFFGLGKEDAASHYEYIVSNCGVRERDVLLRLAETYNRYSRFMDARILFRKYLGEDKVSGFSAMIFADSFYGLGDLSEALKLYSLALKGVPPEDKGYVAYMMELCQEGLEEKVQSIPAAPKEGFWKKLYSSSRELFSWGSENRRFFEKFSGKGGI